jgi:hypothetical protein
MNFSYSCAFERIPDLTQSLALNFVGLHPLVKPFPPNQLPTAHRNMEKARGSGYLAGENVGDMRLGATEDCSHLFDGKDMVVSNCFLHMRSPLMN